MANGLQQRVDSRDVSGAAEQSLRVIGVSWDDK